MEDDETSEPAFFDDADGEVLADLDSGDEAPVDDASELDMDDDADAFEPGEVPDMSRHCFRGHAGPVFAVAAGCIPPQYATGGGDDKAFLWSLSERGAVQAVELAGHRDSVAAVAFSADGSLLATGSLDGRVLIWSALDGALQRTLEGPGGGVDWLLWHPRGLVLLAGSEDYSAWLWNVADGSCMQVFAGHSGPVSCGSFTPDGKAVCTASADGSLRQWNPRSGECTVHIQGYPFHSGPLTCLAISSSGLSAITGSEDTTAKLCNLATGKVLGTFNAHTTSVESVGFCEEAAYVATASLDGRVIVWDVQSFSIRHICEHDAPVSVMKWVPASLHFFSGANDGVLRLWDGRSGTCERTWSGHTDAILDFCVATDGQSACTCSEDGTARVFVREH